MTNFKINKLPNTDELQRAAEQVQTNRRETAARLLAAAEELAEAQDLLADRERAYKQAWKYATKEAWSTAELTKQGFPNPIRTRTKKMDK